MARPYYTVRDCPITDTRDVIVARWLAGRLTWRRMLAALAECA